MKKKTTLDERIGNAMNAFFATQTDSDRFAMTFDGGAAALAIDDVPFTEKGGKWLRLLREIVLFGPGTFALFFYTLTMVFYYPSIAPPFYMYLLAVFAVFAGAGSIKDLKNLAVPAAVIMLALAVVGLSTFLLGRELADLYFWNSIYLLPVVLIVAKLVQNWVSDK